MASDELCKDFYDLLYKLEDRPLEENAKGPKTEEIPEIPGKSVGDRFVALFEGLYRKYKIRLWEDRRPVAPGLDTRAAILLLRLEFERILRSGNTSEDLKDALELGLSNWIGCVDDLGETLPFADAIAIQEGLLSAQNQDVELGQLHKVFLPGDIVFTVDPTPLPECVYEQCWMITTTQPVLELGQEALKISGVKLCFDASSENGWYLASAKVLVYTQDSRKRITFEEIGVYPLKALSPARRKSFSDKMVARGKLYFEMSQANVRCWQYRGPAACPSQHSSWQLENHEGQKSRRLSEWMFWDSVVSLLLLYRQGPSLQLTLVISLKQISDRVVRSNVVATDSIQSMSSTSHWLGHTDEMSNNHDRLFLICSGSIFVRTLPDFAWVSVSIDHLKPVAWDECALNPNGLSLRALLSRPHDSRSEARSLQSTCQSRGRIVILRTRTACMPHEIIAVAENAKRHVIRLDLLDIIDHEGDYLQRVQSVFAIAYQIEAYLYLENFSSLVAKRSCKDPKGCVENRRFIDLLRSYRGVTLISLSEQDDTDPLFDIMGPVELELHDSTIDGSQPRRHMAQYSEQNPNWEVAEGEDRAFSFTDSELNMQWQSAPHRRRMRR